MQDDARILHGTPQTRDETLNEMDALGTDVAPMNPEELAGFIRSEIDKWAKMAKAAGIQPE